MPLAIISAVLGYGLCLYVVTNGGSLAQALLAFFAAPFATVMLAILIDGLLPVSWTAT